MKKLFVFMAVVIFALFFVGTVSAQEKKAESAA
ncbi:MAG: hypothetical protein H6Q51_2316, partial [Deltaproteobacteria bacterium]|nr:hypothetical protein [Deltaproteobacteria bacterium]